MCFPGALLEKGSSSFISPTCFIYEPVGFAFLFLAGCVVSKMRLAVRERASQAEDCYCYCKITSV